MRRIRPLLIGIAIVAVYWGASLLRASMGIEWSATSIQTYVAGLGIKAPLIFFGLVAFRQVLLIPSAIVLTAGGLLFGVGMGTLLGGAGIVLSGCICFLLARGMGGEWVHERLQARVSQYDERANAAGPMLVGLMTAHPMGLLTPFHLAAGVSGMSLLVFLATVLLAGPIRAASYSVFGSSLVDIGSPRFYVASGVLILITLLPFAHPKVRKRIFSRWK
ncbi:MAG: TVP38/TMEM64 family protein [Deltaproteobacteria bacterium]|nr:MAG: TVP38/TMEM64 family protein [Deltaproteobacteria bacterium]